MNANPVPGIYDESGRYLAPAPLVIICAWCPDFDKTNPANAGVSHGICPTCAAKLEAEAA